MYAMISRSIMSVEILVRFFFALFRQLNRRMPQTGGLESRPREYAAWR